MQFLNRLTATPLTLAAALCGACSPGKLDPDDKCPGEYNSEDITTGCINIPDPPTSPSTASSAESSDVPTTGPGSSTETSSTGSTTMASSTGEVTTENVDDTSSGTTMMGPICGNGEVEGDEQCDDKNAVDDDKCRNNCTAPVCGDGIIDFSFGETCDDSNDIETDDCMSNCVIASCGDGEVYAGTEDCDDPPESRICIDCKFIRWVFATDGVFTGDLDGMSTGGVAFADEKCKEEAKAADLPGTYMAWLSGSTNASAPAERFKSKDFDRYYLLPPANKPSIIAVGWMDLVTKKDNGGEYYLQHPINRNASGTSPKDTADDAWTNTNPDGTRRGDNNCQGWQEAAEGTNFTGRRGFIAETTDKWTSESDKDCTANNRARLYCFQVSP